MKKKYSYQKALRNMEHAYRQDTGQIRRRPKQRKLKARKM